MADDDIGKRALALHRKTRGKLATAVKVDCGTREGLSLAYTPGVAEVCRQVQKNPELAYEMTLKWNSVAVVSDGSRVLGLGNIGPLAAMPVMEGKAALFKAYAGIDAFPICLSCHSADEIVSTVKNISPVFGGINLEDIETPKCFEVEERLKAELGIPVFHDDQHGTAVVVLAALSNALKAVGKRKGDARIAIAGAGAAGSAIAKLLANDGFGEIVVCDSKGIIADCEGMPSWKREIARATNKKGLKGTLADAMDGADAFIGISAKDIICAKDIRRMAADPIVFALSNPAPEISPQEAKKGGARIYGTARADLPNQINNVLGFPGIFRGALLVRSTEITEGMKLAAARAIAGAVQGLSESSVVPVPFDRKVVPAVARAVAQEAMKDGVARLRLTTGEIEGELSRLGLL